MSLAALVAFRKQTRKRRPAEAIVYVRSEDACEFVGEPTRKSFFSAVGGFSLAKKDLRENKNEKRLLSKGE